MNRLIALGITIGILAGVATWLSGTITAVGGLANPLVIWVAFAAWACFYAVGGGTGGLVKTLTCNVSGVIWGFLIAFGAGLGGGSTLILAVFVALGAFAMCVQAFLPPLSFIPGAFIGAAVFFGNGTLFASTLISVIVGALFAFASERAADLLTRSKVAAES